MNATDTVTTATGVETAYIKAQDWLKCPICGIASNRLDYAHNTCSQRCACTAAIVEAIGGLTAIMTPYHVETDAGGTSRYVAGHYHAKG